MSRLFFKIKPFKHSQHISTFLKVGVREITPKDLISRFSAIKKKLFLEKMLQLLRCYLYD